ncbi:MBL fold metallo-hydrolase [Streptomyces sp. ISL-86]|uniref:MBL fold metallo-hydrolase n=1 Tax=Streptomyces sp. ISL-86 TaxID=2819187 RepID=UPI001BE586E2|nr:MBL fold metallo-hydrolase [Streptomyces sp. ISL-86]MBT2457268.1 MBL fold metallo-hydrolase [Streptomyces sp. ISL-86]
MTSKLTLSIFTVPPRAVNVPLPVPAPEGGWTWPPTAATLIAGERDAILVDTVPTMEDARKLADWVEASGKELTTIYITHGHFDHFLGTSTLLDRFPRARVVATEATVRLIEAEAESGHDQKPYGQMFVDEIGSTVVVPEILTDHRLDLEGHEVIAVATGRSDVDDSSYVYVPSLSAVMVGDIAYNDVHPTLVTSDHQKRLAWIQTLSQIQDLKPEIVVAAHQRPEAPDNAQVLADTIAYIQEADRVLEGDPTAAQFIEHMLEAHPTRLNPTTVLYSAAALGLK